MDAKSTKTADVWRERILAQQASGQSVRGWCRSNDCHEHSFYGWRAKLGLSLASPSKRRPRGAKTIAFAEVVVERPAAEPIVLRLRGGRELVFPASMPAVTLAHFVHAIEGTPS